MYIHLQKRKMRMLMEPNSETKSFKIVPNAFMNYKHDATTPQILKHERKLYFDTQLLKNWLQDCLVKIAGFIYAIRKGISPLSVEIIRKDQIKWRPSQWYRWIGFLHRSDGSFLN